ncbi:bifunctional acetate--CoA ligase family protein/GNAT family N-acetyltransferase [Agarivorans sp. TSD2052]|uniref:bifunctional acetate--CoA ligase family protein/GNAT family N-acetyltransferase n=1 Tax=Agarivorans sp. TSD2052 TaxID=2937286 RepID=UPI00201064AE|nr:bifunctional acetate--CoA ligase family protein/GNAT family N-acetyltransferase [Agarivorans sp. TSD2052]UPW17549.1 bifunctional acetate--CoA ligase family protein/GNAT family N-acetyltransferase [Agarivorans sp. TSD2052]
MSQRKLHDLFSPKSIAVIGASNRPLRPGNVVMKNLMSAGFNGPVMPVTPKYKAVLGVLAYPSIEKLPQRPDLAVVCVNAKRLPEVVEKLGQFGCKTAVITAGGLDDELDDKGQPIVEQLTQIVQRYGMRILGPNSLGLILPQIGLNASFAHADAQPGKIAFVSQSAAVCTTVLDWANNKGIGFSSFISLGDALDIDFGELLDYLSRDAKTQVIMLYIDSVKDTQRFMSAARAASRNKAILVIKSGRSSLGAQAASLHTGGLVGNDAVYDAAFKRAGMLRVKDLHELFAAVETLTYANPLRGERLAIISNGGGPAVLAVDALMERGGKLATFSPQTLAQLAEVLPSTWSGQNPLDIVGDADPSRYAKALDIVASSGEADALLLMHAPSALAGAEDTANALIEVIKHDSKARRLNILTNWMGEATAYPGRVAFTKAGIPTYRTPEGAVGAFMHMVEFRRNQKLLSETPSTTDEAAVDQNAKLILQQALERHTYVLETHEAKPLLQAYGLQTIDTWLVHDVEEAISCVNQIGYPVALKVQSPDILHKSDVHGVSLNINNQQELVIAAESMLARVQQAYPQAKVEGMILQRMALTAGAQELRVAVINDPVFGPAIFLGEGGSEWDETKDAAVALPPLNMGLARYLVISALKAQKIRDRRLPNGLKMEALCSMLTRISNLIIDCPEIARLDLNPVLAAGDNITLLDVNMRLQAVDARGAQRLAIRPYPKELEEYCQTKSGNRVLLRPILPEDEPNHLAFDSSLTEEDRYKRYFGARGQMTHEEMALLTQIDYAREMAFIAVDELAEDDRAILGVVRASIDPDNLEAEFAMVVRSDLQGQGLGKQLLQKLIRYYQSMGTQTLSGITMIQNRGMAGLAKHLGFRVKFELEDGVIEMHLDLQNKDQDEAN